MTGNTETFEVGDFARNKIHGHVVLVWGLHTGDSSMFDPSALQSFIISVEEQVIDGEAEMLIQTGWWRSELLSEMEKIQPTFQLIKKAKTVLEGIILYKSITKMDNLTYVELLYKLNEAEKELK